jgi:hypothetical protein
LLASGRHTTVSLGRAHLPTMRPREAYAVSLKIRANLSLPSRTCPSYCGLA